MILEEIISAYGYAAKVIGTFFEGETILVMGYLFGHALEIIIGDVDRYELWVFIGLAALGAGIWYFYLLSKNRESANKTIKPTQ